jgi:hypothetical protein
MHGHTHLKLEFMFYSEIINKQLKMNIKFEEASGAHEVPSDHVKFSATVSLAVGF